MTVADRFVSNWDCGLAVESSLKGIFSSSSDRIYQALGRSERKRGINILRFCESARLSIVLFGGLRWWSVKCTHCTVYCVGHMFDIFL